MVRGHADDNALVQRQIVTIHAGISLKSTPPLLPLSKFTRTLAEHFRSTISEAAVLTLPLFVLVMVIATIMIMTAMVMLLCIYIMHTAMIMA